MNKISKSGLFLMELMVVILLFAICGAICLQMFAYASQTAKDSQALRNAALSAKSVAACHRSMDGDLEAVAQLLSGAVTETGLEIAYDDQWQIVDSQPTYVLALTQQDTVAQIAVETVDGQTIYSLDVAVMGGGNP